MDYHPDRTVGIPLGKPTGAQTGAINHFNGATEARQWTIERIDAGT